MAEVEDDAVALRDRSLVERLGPDHPEESVGARPGFAEGSGERRARSHTASLRTNDCALAPLACASLLARGDHPDAVVEGIGDVEAACRVNRDADGVVQGS